MKWLKEPEKITGCGKRSPVAVSIYPSPEQNPGLSHYQGSLSTGGSLPDLTNLHFPSPLSTPLDPEDGGGGGGYPNLSGGSSTGNLPAAMMHLGIGNSHGLSSSLSNPSIQASLTASQMHMSLSNPSIHSSLRLSSLPNPPPAGLSSSPRRRPAPISPLTLSPGSEQQQQQQRRGLAKQLSPTTIDPFLEQQFSGRQGKALSYQLEQFSLLESMLSSAGGGSCLDPSATSSALCCPQGAHSGLCDESSGGLSKDLSGALSAVPECFDSETGFPLEDELRIEPLSLDGLSMLSDPDMGPAASPPKSHHRSQSEEEGEEGDPMNISRVPTKHLSTWV
ncbi:hypothetical protein CRUP_032673 [Coryphaenoides rupestris]|nr:hypothetical protein CRUP_032673 [Coryphaenoides rupestris]